MVNAYVPQNTNNYKEEEKLKRTFLAFPCHQPETAKALGALCTAEFCNDLGVSNLNLEGDSLNVVNAIKGRGSPRGRYGQVVEDI
jgi:hypothetical protein